MQVDTLQSAVRYMIGKIIFFNSIFSSILKIVLQKMSYNALGLPTLVVGECPKDTIPLARDC
jgi:hypothetical protein